MYLLLHDEDATKALSEQMETPTKAWSDSESMVCTKKMLPSDEPPIDDESEQNVSLAAEPLTDDESVQNVSSADEGPVVDALDQKMMPPDVLPVVDELPEDPLVELDRLCMLEVITAVPEHKVHSRKPHVVLGLVGGIALELCPLKLSFHRLTSTVTSTVQIAAVSSVCHIL